MKLLEYSDVYAPRYGVVIFLCVADIRAMLWAFYAATAVARTRGRLYTYHYTVTTTMTPAFRWKAMRAISMFH